MRVVAIGDPDVLRGIRPGRRRRSCLPPANRRSLRPGRTSISDVGLVLLTPAAREVLEGRLGDREAMWIELPA